MVTNDPEVSLRALFRLYVAANKPLELDFPSGKVVMSVAEMKAALKDDKPEQTELAREPRTRAGRG